MTTPDPNPDPKKDPDFLDFNTLLRSFLDATNLINFRWFLYDEARRNAWLEQHVQKPPSDQTATVTEFKERRLKVRRAAERGLPVAYQGEDLRHRRDRRVQDRVA